jgi:hypothetical protein
MFSSAIKKRKGAVVSTSQEQQRQRLIFDTPIRIGCSDVHTSAEELFIFSPFGLCCRKCNKKVHIQLEERPIRQHLAKHKMDSRLATVRSILKEYSRQCDIIRASGNIDNFCVSKETFLGSACLCGSIFQRKDNARRHCKSQGCDVTKLRNIELVKLCCGRYVTKGQIDTFLNKTTAHITEQFDFSTVRKILEPLLLEAEKKEMTYTHMYLPLIADCKYNTTMFLAKIKNDHDQIHSSPNVAGESLLLSIHEKVENWMRISQPSILMVPGNLRAALQTFEGGDVNEIKQNTTYAMQHNPSALVPITKKIFSFAYRRGMFCERGFDVNDDFEVAKFLKDLLLEQTKSVMTHPFIVEFCLMFPFRFKGDNITMISCDTFSAVFSKVLSACRAGVCSVICSFSENAYPNGRDLLDKIREGSVLHILSPMLRQIREMSGRIPKRRKTTQDAAGNITVDQFFFAFDVWSDIVPRTVRMLRNAFFDLAEGLWWESIVDIANVVHVRVDESTADLSIVGISPTWHVNLPLDTLDFVTSILEMAFHGFGGGSARMSELDEPSMFNCLFINNSIYYSLGSRKVFNHTSRKYKEVERKLPVIIGRFYLLFRVLVQSKMDLFLRGDISSLLPRRVNCSSYGTANVIRDIFSLNALPDMTQVRQFWAGVSNYVTCGVNQDIFLTSNAEAAEKMGHSMTTHANKYASQKVGVEESHFDSYHFAIGDTSFDVRRSQTFVTIADLRQAIRCRYPTSTLSATANYLSLSQKELVEFGYCQDSERRHCLGLLSPGSGKSEVYLVPTIARKLAKKIPKMIIHVSPYSFLTGYLFSQARTAMKKVGMDDVSILSFTGCDIHEGNLPVALQCKSKLPQLLFLNVDAMHNLFFSFVEELKSWTGLIDKIVLDEVHTVFSELAFRQKYRVYFHLSVLGIPIVAMSGSVPFFSVPRLVRRLCLSTNENLLDMKVIRGGDVIGEFP